ncbi:MAG: flagellar export chaperone FliS [Verrucomicrobiae bacterium]|nr:flagellar export chaperone FliS [Verrucomicrobiae bacterium]
MNATFGTSNPYLANQVNSASPVQLVVMLYDGAIRFLHNAYEGFSEANPRQRQEIIHNNLIKTQNILTELNACLDMELGGDVARQLRELYEIFNSTLRQINQNKEDNKSPSSIMRIIRMLTNLRDAWEELSNRTQAGIPSAAPQLAETAV